MSQKNWISSRRCPMQKGGIFQVANWVICNEDVEENVGRGSSCLVYHGEERECSGKNSDETLERKVIVKEFYPKLEMSLKEIVRQEDGRLKISDKVQQTKEFEHYKEQFFQGFHIQKELSNSNAMEIVVKPLSGVEKWGDSYYVISDIHQGKDLSKVKFNSLKKKLKLAIKLSEVFCILHKEKYIMLDIKPENFMWIEEPGAVRILDKDSIISLKEKNVGRMFFNEQYMAPEIEILKQLYEEGSEGVRSKSYLKEWVDVYALGIYFFEVFFGHLPEKKQMGKAMCVDETLREFIKIYGQQIEKVKVEQAGRNLIEILKNMTIDRPSRRWKIDKVQKELEQLYFTVASEHLVPRKQYAKANASFSAYNLLYKYPLFKYGLLEKDGHKEINVALFGSHAMRHEMLSAVISIGQMLDTRLNIYIVAEDVEQFWNTYPVVGESHTVFENTILLEKSDGTVSTTYDKHLVAEPLAKIYLIKSRKKDEKESEKESNKESPLSDVLLKLCKKISCNYFIFMCEEAEENKNLLKKLTNCKEKKGRKVFAAYLNEEEDIDCCKNPVIESFPISSLCFSEKYNEDMFKAQIYQMGLMAHIYYSGYMAENEELDEKAMKKLEKDFKENVYNIASSERCALHGIYKMASLGISPDKPGKILKYFRQIQIEEIRRKLSYIEHLSWTAYMLTSGVLPIDVEKMDSYAYKRESELDKEGEMKFNDWKEKKAGVITRHPLLVSSSYQRGLPKRSWSMFSQKERESLDELDKVSYAIYLWYKKNKTRFCQEFMDAMDALNKVIRQTTDLKRKEEIQILQKELEVTGKKCIDEMCEETFAQDRKNIMKCNTLLDNMKSRVREDTLLSEGESSQKDIESRKRDLADSIEQNIENVQHILRPVFDSYKDRDFKQADENLIWASLDLLG